MVYVLLTILLLSGILCNAQRNCSSTLYYNCYDQSPSVDFPEQESEMDEYCRVVIERHQCVVDYEDACQDDPHMRLYANSYATILRKICDKNLHYYRGFVESLVCVKPIITDIDACRVDENALQGMRKHVSELIEDDSYNNTACLGILYIKGCTTGVIGMKCGETAERTYIDIFQDLIREFDVCENEVVELFPKLVESIQEKKIPGLSLDCTLSYYDNCIKDVPEFVFPDHETEMNRNCKIYYRVYRCIANYYTECQKGPEYLAFAYSYASVLNEVCDEDSDYYPVVAASLQCVKPIMMDDDICEWDPYIVNEMVEFVANSVEEHLFENAVCWLYIHEFGCKASKLGEKCGKTVQRTYMQIFEELLGSFNICRKEIVEMFPAIADIYGEAEMKAAEFKKMSEELSK